MHWHHGSRAEISPSVGGRRTTSVLEVAPKLSLTDRMNQRAGAERSISNESKGTETRDSLPPAGTKGKLVRLSPRPDQGSSPRAREEGGRGKPQGALSASVQAEASSAGET